MVATLHILAVASAAPYNGYPITNQYRAGALAYAGGLPYGNTAALSYAAPASPAASLNGPLGADPHTLTKEGVQGLNQAMHKLNELTVQLPSILAYTDPKAVNLAKVTELVNDICAKIIANGATTASTGYGAAGIKGICDKVGAELQANIGNPAVFQKYASQLHAAVNGLNALASQVTY